MGNSSWVFILLSCILQLIVCQNAPSALLVNPTEEVPVTFEVPTEVPAEVPTTSPDETPENSPPTESPLALTSTEFVDSGNLTGNDSSSNRFPRGTVYQIRPVPFAFKENLEKSPFLNNPDVDAVSDFKFPALKSLSSQPAAASPAFPYPGEDTETSATTFQLPKYLQAFVRDSIGSSSSEESEERLRPQASASVSGLPLAGDDSESPVVLKKSKKNKPSPNFSRLPVAGDRSYAFGYTLDDHSRHEIADPQGNVNGYYTYVDDEGYLRKVVYTAGPGKGFVVLNKERKAGPLTQVVVRKKSTNTPPTIGSTTTKKPIVIEEVDEAPLSSNSSGEEFEPKERDSRGSKVSSGKKSGEYSSKRSSSVEEGVSESEYLPGGFPTWLSEIAHGSVYPIRNNGRKPVFVVKVRRPHRHERRGGIHTLDYLPEGAVVATATPLTVSGIPLPRDHHARKRSRKGPSQRIKQIHSPPVFLVSGGDGSEYSSSSEESVDEIIRPALRPSYRPPSPSPPAVTAPLTIDEDGVDNGQWDGYLGDGTDGPAPPKRRSKSNPVGTSNTPAANPDASYSFGYETDTANRLEKSDGLGNVRGSYSYVDANGVKRTVHYIAGAATGFQVVGSSPSSQRSVRIEAPPGFLISRKKNPSSSSGGGGDVGLAQAASSIQPASAVVYHIHPDSNWRPWEAAGRKPRKMRKVMRMVRKKVRPTKEEMPYDENPSTLMVQTHPDPESRPFRHSTRVVEEQALAEASKAFFERRRESHRAYTDIPRMEQPSSGLLDDQGPSKEPILYSGLKYEALSESRDSSRRIPNPILLRPSAVSVRNRGAAAAVEVAAVETETIKAKKPRVKSDQPAFGEGVAESIHSLQQQPAESSSSLRVTTTTQSISSNGVPTVGSTTISSLTLDTTSEGTTTEGTTTEVPGDENAVQIARRRRRGPRNRQEKKTPSPVVIKMVTRDQKKESEEDDLPAAEESKVERRQPEISMSSSIRLMRKLKRAT